MHETRSGNHNTGNVSIGRPGGCDGTELTLAYVFHGGRFFDPIILGGMHDTQRITPGILYRSQFDTITAS